MKAQPLSGDEANEVSYQLGLIRTVQSDASCDLFKWLDGLRVGLGYFGVNEQQNEALEKLDKLRTLQKGLSRFWLEGAKHTSRYTSDPVRWASKLACLEGGPHCEADALDFVAGSLAHSFLNTPRDISLGLYAIAQLYQADRLVRGAAVNFIADIREKLGPSMDDAQERMFGPWHHFDLNDLVHTSSFARIDQKIAAIRNEVDVAELRAIAALSLWQVAQLVKTQCGDEAECKRLLEQVRRYSKKDEEGWPEVLPLDFDKRVARLLPETHRASWPLMQWEGAKVPSLWRTRERLFPLESPGIQAVRLMHDQTWRLLESVGAKAPE